MHQYAFMESFFYLFIITKTEADNPAPVFTMLYLFFYCTTRLE